MLDIIWWFCLIALRVMLVYLAFVAIKAMIRNPIFKDVVETIILMIRLGCLKLKQRIVEALRKDAEEKEQKEDPAPEENPEGAV